jgi:subtilisin family serine protease
MSKSLPHHPSFRRATRAALVALASGSILVGLAGESYAQFSFGSGRGMSMGRGGNMSSGNGMTMGRHPDRETNKRHPIKIGQHPGRERPRHPGGPRRPGGPRIPGGIIPGIIAIPGGPIVPGGGGRVVVIEDDDAPQRRPNTRNPKQKQTSQNQQQAQRGGFNPPPPGENRFVPNEVVLNVGALSVTQFDALARRNRLTRLDLREFTLPERRLARVRINDGRPVGTVIRSLQREASIIGAQPNYLYTLEQGGGSAAALDQYAFAKMRVPEAHALSKGDSVRVAVIDTTIDMRHPVLAGVVTESFDAMGALDKPHAHGTGIAGVIAAHGRLTGVAPSVKILGIAAFASLGSKGSSWNILNGIEKAGTARAQVVNMSFAGPSDPEIHAKIVALRQRGVVVIAAAGNAGPNAKPLYPGAFPEVIAVTATDADDKIFAQANRGTHIAVAAPGVAILAAAPEESYRMQSGTSFAAAQVSGVVALLLERNRNLDVPAIRRILMTSARDLGTPGHDDQFGSGIVDAYAALEKAAPRTTDTSAAAATR